MYMYLGAADATAFVHFPHIVIDQQKADEKRSEQKHAPPIPARAIDESTPEKPRGVTLAATPSKLIIARVCIGEFIENQDPKATPATLPKKANGAPYETMVDSIKKPTTFVTTLEDQAYPEFIVTLAGSATQGYVRLQPAMASRPV